MSKAIKFTISDDNYKALVACAGNLTIQDYIRSVLFPEKFSEDKIITPENAVVKALEKYSKGDRFTVPDIFGDDWDIALGYSGIFGRRFNKLVVDKYGDKIRFTDAFNKKRQAIYEIL